MNALAAKIFAQYDSLNSTPLPLLLQQLLEDQQRVWPLATEGYASLQYAQIREVECRTATAAVFSVKLQFNPKRIVSTGAKVDDHSIRQRRCFLCVENLPKEQQGVLYRQEFLLLCNPMPIFPAHYTISHVQHRPQLLAAHWETFLQLAQDLSPAFTVFYNGARCGASAPDHLHFQAAPAGKIPIEHEVHQAVHREFISAIPGVAIILLNEVGRAVIVLEGSNAEKLTHTLQQLFAKMQVILQSSDEPQVNILCRYESPQWRVILFPRRKHRPDIFFKEGDGKVLISPASVDMGGLIITPVEKDFRSVDANMIETIYREVSWDESAINELKANLHPSF